MPASATSSQALTDSSEGEYNDEDFSLPSPKRRRISSGGGSNPEVHAQTVGINLPSRVTRVKSIPAPSVDAVKEPSNTITSTTSTTSTTFDAIGVSPWLVHSLRALAIINPTEIQQSCIPEILKGRDCIGGSRTGTGKTVAFAVPILQQWAKDPFGVYAVVLTPTRELALQIYEQFLALGASQSLKVVLITGGSDMREQAIALSRRPHLVVATPGRLADHILTSGPETIVGLTRTKVVVLDEADRLLAPGPGSMLPDLNTCLSYLPDSKSRLTLLFTATVTPEVRALKTLARPPGKPPLFISEIADDQTTSTAATHQILLPSTLTQTYVQVPITQKDSFLHVLLQVKSLCTPTAVSTVVSASPQSPPSIIIFVNRTQTADILSRTLAMLGHPVTSLHSRLPQSQRIGNLQSFRGAKTRILIATDVASRGLDIPDVAYVINYDLPRDPADYVHRVGRTARAGKPGTSISFVTQRDVELVLAIEEYVRNGARESSKGDGASDNDDDRGKMQEWKEEGVNLETRVTRGRTLKDVGEARMEALREVEQGRDQFGRRKQGLRKERTHGRKETASVKNE
ncbi:hypothetical protein DV737_g876, partial [Chaetothyriales sp. CBS 132003]